MLLATKGTVTMANKAKAHNATPWSLAVPKVPRSPLVSPPAATRRTNTPVNPLPFPFQIPFPGQPLATSTQAPSTTGAFKASGKTVVITGGSQGIGRAAALLFARKGYNVVVAARNAENLKYVAEDCAKVAGRQGSSMAVVCDVTDERQVRSLANQVMARYESVDVLVNNAGVLAMGKFHEVPAVEVDRLMRTNFLGAYMVTQAFLPQLMKEATKKQGVDRPSIIMVNSFAGRVPMKSMSAFTASKYALLGFTEAIKAELTPLHIHVASVHPGVVKSNHMERTAFFGQNEAEERNTYRQNVRSLPISQQPLEVADVIYNAASTKSGDQVVGAPFAAVDLAYKATGLNPLAMPFSFL